MPVSPARILRKYLALRIPSGTPVRYFGSVTEKHGIYTAEPCNCSMCFKDICNGAHATRYALYEDGQPTGLHDVRHTSVAPHTGARESVTDWLPSEVTEVHVRRKLEKEFPGTYFCATMSGTTMEVLWTGGPLEMAVQTICAPAIATYAKNPSDAPRPIQLTAYGRRFYGTPRISQLRFSRDLDLM